MDWKLTVKVVFIFTVLVIAGVILDRMEKKPEYDINLSPEVDAVQLCYDWTGPGGDRAMLSMDIRGEDVIGEFYWLPFEKDKKTGIFRGKVSPLIQEIMGRRIEGEWEANAEGTTNIERIKIEFGDGSAIVQAEENGGFVGYPQLGQTDCGNDQNAID